MVQEFAHSIERFLTVFNNRVLNNEYDLMNKLENTGLNKISKEEVEKWHNLFFSINNNGFNMIKSNKKNAKKMKEHLDLYQNVKHDRNKVNEILEEMSISEIIDEEFNKVDISFLRAGMVISKDIYDDKGIKIKSAYEMISDKDIENFYDKGIKDIFLENPLHSELHPENFRIALIDIISDGKYSLKEWLESLGFIITQYDEPRKALGELIKEDFTDLLILDVDMPDIDGLTFLENLRTSTFGKKLPVIIIAKVSDLESVKRAISLKAFHYIKKPINKELVIKKIAQILSLSTLLNPKDKNEDSNDNNS
jgi:two-component system chemotaxis response regulator CheY